MKLFHHDTHNISSHYLPALINGDISGLSDSDIDLVEDYVKQFEGFYVVYDVKDHETNFSRCIISGLLSDCCSVGINLQLIYKDGEVNYLPDIFFCGIKTTELPRNNSVTGYGNKLPTQYILECNDGYKRRVYARCYSNAASYYIVVKGKEFYLHSYQI